MILKAIILTLSLLSTAGCVRYHWMAPELNGTVIDIKTKNPIDDVEVIRVPDGGKLIVVARTAADGSFRVSPVGAVVFTVPIGDPGYFGVYLFRKDGYAEQQLDYGVITGDVLRKDPPRFRKNAVVELHPQ